MTDNRLTDIASTCVSYRPGHHVHFTQARKSLLEGGQSPIAASVVVHPDGLVELHGEHLNNTMWTHDPERLRLRLRDTDARGEWRPRYGVLSVNDYLFNLAKISERSACISRAEAVQARDGFLRTCGGYFHHDGRRWRW
ncbi:hypothetical protein ACIGKQ_23410 [Gordonia sp. NPDC062954]|uniref:hypothetical protein n=1 Tax=Gordonia sp. NPDC062954 TaxID=3364003 RepID=UPI0037C51941